MYVNVFGMLAWAGLYLLGFMLLPIAIYMARRKWPWCLLLFVYLVGPLGWIGIHIAKDRTGKAKEPQASESEYRRRNDLMAFSLYCNAPGRVVHATVDRRRATRCC